MRAWALADNPDDRRNVMAIIYAISPPRAMLGFAAFAGHLRSIPACSMIISSAIRVKLACVPPPASTRIIRSYLPLEKPTGTTTNRNTRLCRGDVVPHETPNRGKKGILRHFTGLLPIEPIQSPRLGARAVMIGRPAALEPLLARVKWGHGRTRASARVELVAPCNSPARRSWMT